MPNRLADSTSPYLRQHEDNPVDWYEWGEEAFAEARRRDVPVLLSVGYSACHWCHVMAHESFEDGATAAQMNADYVNVKVDREERPDVDAVYMSAVQATTGHGGWPMTVWLDHDGRPFYAGTYFPKGDMPGRPGFRRVLAAVTEAWLQRRDQIGEQAEKIRQAISRTLPPASDLGDESTLQAAHDRLAQAYDPVNGGFGGAPKFPQQPVLDFLIHAADRPWAPQARSMVRQTLLKMARGGIHDHVGGGFARYAVDSVWLVPHFEKMLYDNAQLARLYLRGWQVCGIDEFRRVAERTLEYLMRDLSHPDGGFFAAEDADSEGVEGKFSVWSRDEFLAVVGPDHGPVAADVFGVTDEGNFEGSNILHLAATPGEVAERHGIAPDRVAAAHAAAVDALLEARSRRVRPGLDHKVIASWNGMAIRAFAEAGAILERDDLLERARRCARFVGDHLTRDGRLLRSWSEGMASIPGFLEDYGAVATGLFTLYAATGETEWYEQAMRLTRAIPELFSDPAGGFFTTGADADPLVTRPKDQMDNPHPSGNSMAAEALLLASLYTGDQELRRLAERTVMAGGLLIDQHPSAAGHLLGVFQALVEGPTEVAIVGDGRALERVVWSAPRPGLALAVDRSGSSAGTVPLLAGRFTGESLAYVCHDFVCDAPVADPQLLARQLTRR
jgi:uncharacterized protein YyaL (SSP411 family)